MPANLCASATNDNARFTSMNAQELTSIAAMIAYAAHVRHATEEEVQADLALAFGVEDVKEISSDHYEDVTHYLVDRFFEHDFLEG